MPLEMDPFGRGQGDAAAAARVVEDRQLNVARQNSASQQRQVDRGLIVADGLIPTFNRHTTIGMMSEVKEETPGSTSAANNDFPVQSSGEEVENKDDGTSPSAASTGATPTRKRPQWGSKMEYLLSCIGYAVGLGNLWRFPMLCYENGGGAFLIPYCLALLFLGVPMFILELAIGQSLQLASMGAWRRVHSKLSGLGVCSLLLSALCACYYNVIVAWAIYYFVHSFYWVLPWTVGGVDFADSAQKYWLENVLRKSATMAGDPSTDSTNYFLVLCLTIAWICVLGCVYQGIESSGKVVYFTALLPYVVLSILFIRGITLPGALQGIIFYLKPDFSKLLRFRVWSVAGSQIFFSTGIGWGSLINFASFNSRKNDIFSDALIVCSVNAATSLLAGFVVFSVVGYMAHLTGTSIEDVAQAGSGLAFVVYPAGLGTMSAAWIFSSLFFMMLICLGIDSQFCMVEVVLTACIEASLFRNVIKKLIPLGKNFFPQVKKWKVAMGICVSMWGIGLLLVSPVGIYWVDLLDDFCGAFALYVVVLAEVLAVVYIYSLEKLEEDIYAMTSKRLGVYLRYCYKYVTPIGTFLLLISSVMVFADVNERRENFEYRKTPSQGNECALSTSACGSMGTCDPTYDVCHCDMGYSFNTTCLKAPDPSLFYCPENCNSNGICNTKTGICQCFAKFEGPSCKGDRYGKGFPDWAIVVGFLIAIASILPLPLMVFSRKARRFIKQGLSLFSQPTTTSNHFGGLTDPRRVTELKPYDIHHRNMADDNDSSDDDDNCKKARVLGKKRNEHSMPQDDRVNLRDARADVFELL